MGVGARVRLREAQLVSEDEAVRERDAMYVTASVNGQRRGVLA
jgi:hypothetical protein